MIDFCTLVSGFIVDEGEINNHFLQVHVQQLITGRCVQNKIVPVPR